jgi:hypothetical protein
MVLAVGGGPAQPNTPSCSTRGSFTGNTDAFLGVDSSRKVIVFFWPAVLMQSTMTRSRQTALTTRLLSSDMSAALRQVCECLESIVTSFEAAFGRLQCSSLASEFRINLPTIP